jgi:hypothetical protein
MGRRDDEQLPPVEVVGVGSEITSVQHVSTGGPGGPRGRRRLGLIVALVVVGLLVAGAMLGGDDGEPVAGEREEETTTTRRSRTTTTSRPTTTTTTTPPVTAPLFAGFDVRGWLLSGGQGGWTLFDIGTGQELESNLSFDNPYSTRAVTGGVVMVIGGQARHYDLRLPEGERTPVDLGPADQVVAAVERDQVWLIDGTRATLLDLEGRELRSFPVPAAPFDPAMAHPDTIAATTEGLLFARAGRVYLVSEGGVEAVAIGELVGALESAILVYGCGDDAAACSIDLRSLSGALIRRLDVKQVSSDFGWGVSSASDGRFALLTHPPSPSGDASVLTLHRPDGSIEATIDVVTWMAFAPNWLPNDAGLIGARNGSVVWIHQTSEGWVLDSLGALSMVQSEGVLAIYPE